MAALDHTGLDLQVGSIGSRTQRQKRVAHGRHRAGHAPHRRDGPCTAPAAAAVKEAVEDADGRRGAPRLGLLDDDVPLPGKRVDDKDVLDARRLERLFRLEIA